MKSGIENSSALPDAMLRDVLVANPQSAKSGEVMRTLDKRIVPLPEEMREEVQEGINVFASYDNMLANLAFWNHRLGEVNTGIARIFARDTILARSSDSLAMHFANLPNLEAKYQLALLETARGNSATAQAILSNILNTTPLSNKELVVHSDYTNLISQLSNLLSADTILLSFDSAYFVNLCMLAQKDDFMPGAIARNILHAAGNIEYCEPINLNQATKYVKTEHKTAKTELDRLDNDFSLFIYPNPAVNYCSVKYVCKQGSCDNLQISNAQGKIVEIINLRDKMNPVIIPLKSYLPGTYRISLLRNNTIGCSSQLIIK
jgi:hypothetical protein